MDTISRSLSLASLLTSTDVPVGEKELALNLAQELYKFLRTFDDAFLTRRVKALNNAIIGFSKGDPSEFQSRSKKLKDFGKLLDEEFKTIMNELNSFFDKLSSIKDEELNKIKDNIFINADNVIELLSQLRSMFESPTAEFKTEVPQKLLSIITRGDDLKRIIREDLIGHLISDIAGKKQTFAKFENNRIKRRASWRS